MRDQRWKIERHIVTGDRLTERLAVYERQQRQVDFGAIESRAQFIGGDSCSA
jgi:hypothetical protein